MASLSTAGASPFTSAANPGQADQKQPMKSILDADADLSIPCCSEKHYIETLFGDFHKKIMGYTTPTAEAARPASQDELACAALIMKYTRTSLTQSEAATSLSSLRRGKGRLDSKALGSCANALLASEFPGFTWMKIGVENSWKLMDALQTIAQRLRSLDNTGHDPVTLALDALARCKPQTSKSGGRGKKRRV